MKTDDDEFHAKLKTMMTLKIITREEQ